MQPRTMTAFDRELVEFVVAWLPYGGPSEEEAFVEFGMSRERLRQRFLQIVRRFRSRSDLPDEETALILRAQTMVSAIDVARRYVTADTSTTPEGGRKPASCEDLASESGRWILNRGVHRWQRL